MTIEGFYDDVEPMSAADRAAVAMVPDVNEQFKEAFGLGASELGGAMIGALSSPAARAQSLHSGSTASPGRGKRRGRPPSSMARV
ncbi:MAG: hypothetical protein IH888_01105 [Planctomycetes bacterium]|nr:hypothetical protein [Planctomycetota bacterium]